MRSIKIGVIGSGGRGVIAVHAHQPDAGSQVVACCDLDPRVLEENRVTYGQELFTTSGYRQLLARDLDAVFIATPDFLHEEMAVAALDAGVAVYLEKPMAITTQGCDRILAAAQRSGAKLYVGHNMRHMRFVQTMKELIDAGAIGKVKSVWCRHFVGNGGDYYFKDWHAERQYSTGLLLQKGAHDIDIIHWLAGGYSLRVHGFGDLTLYGDNPRRKALPGVPPGRVHVTPDVNVWPPREVAPLHATVDIEDLSLMQMALDNGVLASYQQCHYTPDYWRNYCVIGDEGRLENFGNGEEGSSVKVWSKRKVGWAEADVSYDTTASSQEGHGGADERIINEFLRFVREGGPTMTSPLAARHSVAAGCAATRSLRQGGELVEVPPVDAAVEAYFENDQRQLAPSLEVNGLWPQQQRELALNGSKAH